MNKQELIDELKKEIEATKNVSNFEEHVNLYEKGKRIGLEIGWMFAEKLDEPEITAEKACKAIGKLGTTGIKCAENERTTQIVEITEEQAWEKISETLPISIGTLKGIVYSAAFNGIPRYTQLKSPSVLEMSDFDFEKSQETEQEPLSKMEPTNPTISKKESVEVPKFIADWFESYYKRGGTPWEVMKIIMTSDSVFDDAFVSWAKEDMVTAVKAIFVDYTVEPEKLYRLVLPKLNQEYEYAFIDEVGEIDFSDHMNSVSIKAKQFTEKEIKAMDKRYWPFAEAIKGWKDNE